MNTMFSLIIVAGLVALIFYVAGVLFYSIIKNHEQSLKFRERLALKLSGMRLKRLLDKESINEAVYLHAEPIVNIEKQMTNCAGCKCTEDCDKELAKTEEPSQVVSFCPNYKDIEKYKSEAVNSAS